MSTVHGGAKQARTGGAVAEVSPREAAEWVRSGEAVLIDVREADEHARERIAGSVLRPLSGFDGARAAAEAGSHRLVLHCKSGRRSAEAARLAAAAGACAYSLAGGIEAWKREGLPVEVDTRVSRISVMRQVQLVVGTGVLIGSALAWFAHPGFIVIPAFFGAGLLVAGATGTCGLAALLELMPWNRAGRSGGAKG